VDFTLDDNAMSRQHFQVVGQAGIWVLEDLGSTNGTYLNGQRARRAALKDGDAIRAGGTELRFVQKDMLAGTPSALKAPVPRRRRR
jgi:pSer/pThr/pTyr-binding forkhead associated (FHA) protein